MAEDTEHWKHEKMEIHGDVCRVYIDSWRADWADRVSMVGVSLPVGSTRADLNCRDNGVEFAFRLRLTEIQDRQDREQSS